MRHVTIGRVRSLVLLVLTVTAAAVVLAACGGTSGPAGGAGASTPAEERVVLVAPHGPVEPSSPGGVLRTWLLRGKLPATAVEARVLSDEECEADSAGISRCLNRLLMPSGETLVVRHPHNMDSIPCLAPGEKVQVVAASDA